MDDAQRLRDVLDRFEEAWQPDGSIDLLPFLPAPDDSLRPRLLFELIRCDLALRWKHGPSLGIEAYQQKYPELGTTPEELPVEYIYEEYRARWLHGDQTSLGIYQQRFPEQFEALQQLIRDKPVSAIAPPSQMGTQLTVFSPPLPRKSPTPPAEILDQLRRDPPVAALGSPPPPANQASATSVWPAQESSGSQGKMLASGQYNLTERLGRGVFGEVWKAEKPRGASVAVKRVTASLHDSKALQELKALEQIKSLRHPFLVQTQDYFVEDNELYIVMDLADSTLGKRLEEHRQSGQAGIPVQELLGYFRDAAEGLDFLHSQRVQHRDVKPDNILLLQGHAKVADFGLARLLEEHKGSIQATRAVGTPTNMAPEVWQGTISVQSDQYSLAATYVQLRLGASWPNNSRQHFRSKRP